MLPARTAILGTATVVLSSCGGVTVFVTPEGNLALGPRNAATASPGQATSWTDHDQPPPRHIARSALERWQPPPLGLLPPDNLLHNTSHPVRIQAGSLELVLRPADRIVPSWGGDTYVRIDLNAGTANQAPTRRDLAIVLDARDRPSLRRAQHIACALFETLRAGDRGALIVTSEWGRVLVPMLPHSAAPLLIERARSFHPRGADDLPSAIQNAVTTMRSPEPHRIRKLIVLSGSDQIVTGETLEWIQAATRENIEVVLVPLTPAATRRLQPLTSRTDAAVLPHVSEERQHATIDELASLPPAPIVARDFTLVIDSVPGPTHLLEVAGATHLWTPSGGEVPLGDVRVGDRRTLVLRGLVPPWRGGADYELTVRVRYHDDQGPHEIARTLRARYSDSPREYAASRAGDVLQYVSLLNTLSTLQAAIARRDQATVASLREAALQQAYTLTRYAHEHRDATMSEQAALLASMLTVHAPWHDSRP